MTYRWFSMVQSRPSGFGINTIESHVSLIVREMREANWLLRDMLCYTCSCLASDLAVTALAAKSYYLWLECHFIGDPCMSLATIILNILYWLGWITRIPMASYWLLIDAMPCVTQSNMIHHSCCMTWSLTFMEYYPFNMK